MKTTTFLMLGMTMAALMAGCDDEVGVGDQLDGGAPIGDPPARPAAETSSASDSEVLQFVLTDLNIDQQSEWAELGFDLDGRDSTAENDYQGDCTPYAPSGSSAVATPDGVDGIDNHWGGALWPVISQTLPSLECELNWAHDRGQGALLLVVERWNGTANDADVRISLMPALDGTSEDTDCTNWSGESLQNMANSAKAADPDLGDGVPDNYCINPYGLIGQNPGGSPAVQDLRGYIADGQLLMTLTPGARLELLWTRGSMPLALNQGTLYARLSTDFSTIERGFFNGRLPSSTLTEIGPDQGICTPEDFGSVYRANSDVLSVGDDDASGADECDAISFSLGFAGVPARIAGHAPLAVEPFTACDPVTDTPVEPYPVFDCCQALPVSQMAQCEANTTLP